jgi:hypothetical protein
MAQDTLDGAGHELAQNRQSTGQRLAQELDGYVITAANVALRSNFAAKASGLGKS